MSKKFILFLLKCVIVVTSLAAYIYSYFRSDGTFFFYLQFSLLLNFLLVLLFSISTREDEQLNRKFYKTFPISKTGLLLVRIKRILLNPFYLIISISSISIFTNPIIGLQEKLLYVISFNAQFGITLIASFMIYDILQKHSAEKQFFLIPLMLISLVNLLVQTNIDPRFLLLDFFGGFFFMIYFLGTEFDIVIFGGLVLYFLGFILLLKMYNEVEG